MSYMSHIAFPSLVTLIRRAIGPSEQGYMQFTGVGIPEKDSISMGQFYRIVERLGQINAF